MHYTGKLFYPRGATLLLDKSSLSPIQGHTAFVLYGQLKKAMVDDEFDACVDAAGSSENLMLRFRRVGQTAAYMAYARGEDDEPQTLEAVSAILPRLDPEDDEQVVQQLQANPYLHVIDAEDWESARAIVGPLVAAFFTSEESLNDPLIHGIMSLVGAAFLDHLGMLE